MFKEYVLSDLSQGDQFAFHGDLDSKFEVIDHLGLVTHYKEANSPINSEVFCALSSILIISSN